MKALRIAFFACVLSVFFCIPAFAESRSVYFPAGEDTQFTMIVTDTITTNPGDNFAAFNYEVYLSSSVNGLFIESAGVTSVLCNAAGAVCQGSQTSIRAGQVKAFLLQDTEQSSSSQIQIWATILVTVRNRSNSSVSSTISTRSTGNYSGQSLNLSNLFEQNADIYNRDGQILQNTNDILAALTGSTQKDFLGPDALIYFDPRYFESWSDSVSEDSSGYFNVQTDSPFAFWNRPSSPAIFFDVGQYYVIVSANGGNVKNLEFQTDDSYYSLEFVHNYANKGSILDVFLLDVHHPFTTFEIAFNPRPGETLSGLFYGGIVPRSSSDTLSDALNPDQDNKNNELNSEANKQSQQENQLWQNVNTYKSKLDFSLTGWNEATKGIGYVSSIFMMVWNNSPRQIITLSLMLGIGMLAIGRGVKAAVRQRDGES